LHFWEIKNNDKRDNIQGHMYFMFMYMHNQGQTERAVELLEEEVQA